MEKYKEINEGLVQEVQTMRKRLQELRTEIVRMRAEESDKYTENVLLRKQITKFMLNTCYRFVDMIEPNTELHEQLGNILLKEWQGNTYEDDMNISNSIRQCKLQERWKTDSISNKLKDKHLSSGLRSSTTSVSTSGRSSDLNESIGRRRSSSEFAAEFRRSSNLIQSNSFGSNKSPRRSLDDKDKLEEHDSNDEKSQTEENDENEIALDKDTQDQCKVDSLLSMTCPDILNQVIYEDDEKNIDDKDEKDNDLDDEEQGEEDKDNDTQDDISTTETFRNDESSDVDESETEEYRTSIKDFNPVLITPKYLSARKEYYNKSNKSNMDMSMSETTPTLDRRATNIQIEDMEVVNNSTLLNAKTNLDKTTNKCNDENTSSWYNSNLKSNMIEKPTDQGKRNNINNRSPLRMLNIQDSTESWKTNISERDSGLLSINQSVETLRDVISTTMDIDETLTLTNYQAILKDENRSFNSSSNSQTLVNTALSIPPSNSKYDMHFSTKFMNSSSSSRIDNSLKSEIFDSNWETLSKYSTSSMTSLLSTQSSEQDNDESALSSRPRRRCRPGSLAEPSLRYKLRDESGTKKRHSKKSQKR